MPYLVPEWQGLWENSPTAKPILLERPKRSQSSEVIPIFFFFFRENSLDFNGENLVQNLKNAQSCSTFFFVLLTEDTVIINFLV